MITRVEANAIAKANRAILAEDIDTKIGELIEAAAEVGRFVRLISFKDLGLVYTNLEHRALLDDVLKHMENDYEYEIEIPNEELWKVFMVTWHD